MEDLEGRGPRVGPPGVGGYPGDPGELSTEVSNPGELSSAAARRPKKCGSSLQKVGNQRRRRSERTKKTAVHSFLNSQDSNS